MHVLSHGCSSQTRYITTFLNDNPTSVCLGSRFTQPRRMRISVHEMLLISGLGDIIPLSPVTNTAVVCTPDHVTVPHRLSRSTDRIPDEMNHQKHKELTTELYFNTEHGVRALLPGFTMNVSET